MIICGTDLSESSAATARVAGSIAQALGRPLLLVHVVSDAPRGTLESRLGAQADDLRLRFDIAVEARLERGAPDERLVALADELQAQLLVVSALGDRRQHRWLLGSVAERVAQASPVPVLVVRDGGRLEAWARGQGALRVMVGVELTPASQVALRWARGLRAIGPCELLVTYVAWPPAEHRRLDATSPVPLDRLGPGLEDTLLRALEEWAGE